MITITKNIEEAKFVTHAGNFHADDCFSTVFLNKLFDNITVIRLKEYYDDENRIVYDIGGSKFDHHSPNPQKRSDGITYCGFGLLWQEYGKEYLKKIQTENIEDTFKVLDYLFVESIDAFDNGEVVLPSKFNIYSVSSLIELFRPLNDEDEDECFLAACNFADTIFDKVVKNAIAKVKVIEKIKNLPIKNKILILDEYIPYEFACFYLKLDVNFVVYPSNRGGYAAHTIPTTYKGFQAKIPFKSEWGGLRDEELARVSGIKTTKFCHNKLFLATADTLEDALEFINKTLE